MGDVMSEIWQQVLIYLVLAGAVAYLVRRIVKWRDHRRQCAECPLIKNSIDGPKPPAEKNHAN
jgi:hypothetical protein